MDIEKHHKEFQSIIKKYKLDEKAEELSDYIMGNTSSEALAQKYGMTIEEANIFLHFIQKTLEFKEKHLNKL